MAPISAEKAPEVLTPEVLALGQAGILVRFAHRPSYAAAAACLAFQKAAEDLDLPGLREIAPSLTSVLVQFDPAQVTRASLLAPLTQLAGARDWTRADLPAPTRRWHIPVAFGGAHGPQLTEFADLAGIPPDQAVADVTGCELRVLAIGFAPGQPYLGYLPDHWNVPRQRNLTPQVNAGAIATAVQQLVLFTNASTTGWRQIGETAFRPFLQQRREPFLLRQGDALRFSAVAHDAYEDLKRQSDDGLGGARCEVLS